MCLIREEYEHDEPDGLNSVMREFASLALTRTRAKNKVSAVLKDVALLSYVRWMFEGATLRDKEEDR